MSSSPSTNELEILARRVDRERNARAQAEAILEEKSRELYQANSRLHQVAENLREEIEKTQAIVDHAAQGIVTVDANAIVQSFNPAAENIFGISRDEVINRDFTTLFAKFPETPIIDFDHDHNSEPLELIGRRADGAEIAIELSLSPVSSIKNDLWIALLRDQTARKKLEAQLAHAQKMESVGQLAAGIAHEINTPIQFVGDNLRFMADTFGELQHLFDLLDALEPLVASPAGKDGQLDQLLKQLTQAKETADLGYIREEIPQAVDQSITGIERVASIVHAMKEFSHPGTEEATAVDVNLAIQSTLTVSRNEWKYIAEVDTELEPNLPAILGYPGDLNQALLNMIVNSAHAIEQKRSDMGLQEMGKIRIVTSSLDEGIELLIADDGCGIPDDTKQKIFDPFFTTKGVGKGTGQGLSVVHNVLVEKHKGHIDVQSIVGRGTEIRIRLPIDPIHGRN